MKTIFDKSRAMALKPGEVASGKAVSESTCRGRLKSLIVTAALWGCLPFALADWLIQRGGLSHD